MQETQDLGDAVFQTEQDLERLRGADVVFGVPSYNNSDTIASVIGAARAGLAQYLPECRAVIVHADGGSKDQTVERALEAAENSAILQVPFRIHPVDRLSEDITAMPGKANALRTIFLVARRLGAKACAVVGGSARGVTPDWLDRLVRPVLEKDFDFVAPYYRRHKFDGSIAKGILYPMTRALYGKRIRQPGSGEFAVSSRFAEWRLDSSWDANISSTSADFWLDVKALAGRFRMCQAYLGPKLQDPDGPAPDLSLVLSHLLGCLFADMTENAAIWQKVRGSEPVPAFGPPFECDVDPAPVNVKRMIESYRLGHRDLQSIWCMVIPPATLLELKRLSLRPDDGFRLEDHVWARALYDFALAYRLRTIDRDHLLRAFTPLYLGWAASFIIQMQDASSPEVEQRVEKLCLAFEAQKPYLISRWRWPDRFNP